jgi:hypothetical protein
LVIAPTSRTPAFVLKPHPERTTAPLLDTAPTIFP